MSEPTLEQCLDAFRTTGMKVCPGVYVSKPGDREYEIHGLCGCQVGALVVAACGGLEGYETALNGPLAAGGAAPIKRLFRYRFGVSLNYINGLDSGFCGVRIYAAEDWPEDWRRGHALGAAAREAVQAAPDITKI